MRQARRLSWVAVLLAGLVAGCYGSLIREVPDGGGKCPAGLLACAGVCADGKTDDSNCGACGHTCASTEGCAAGACISRNCPDALCGPDMVCVSTGCRQRACVGVKCPLGESCYDGVCQREACDAVACAPDSICLDGGCTDVTCLGVQCPAGRACHGGTCSACTAGLACASNPNKCFAGRTACAGEVSSCTDGPLLAAGTTCGSAQVCLADGGCVACATGAPCATNPTACVPGKLDCSAGPSCVDGPGASPAGTLCETNRVCRADGGCGACGAVPCPSGLACITGTCRTPVASCGALKNASPIAPSGEYLLAPGGTPTWAYCDLSGDAGQKLCEEGTAKTYSVVTQEGSQLAVSYVAQLDHAGNACTVWKLQSVDGGYPLKGLTANAKDSCQALGFALKSDAGVPCCYGTVAGPGIGCPTVSNCGFTTAPAFFRFGDACSGCSTGNGTWPTYVLQGPIKTGFLLSDATGASSLRCLLR